MGEYYDRGVDEQASDVPPIVQSEIAELHGKRTTIYEMEG